MGIRQIKLARKYRSAYVSPGTGAGDDDDADDDDDSANDDTHCDNYYSHHRWWQPCARVSS